MRSIGPAGRYVARGVRHGRAHSSPRSANTGSRPTARRIAAALPAKVTITAIGRTTGSSTGGIEISELKMECPQRGFSKKNRGDRKLSRPQNLHQPDLSPAFKNSGGHGRRNRQCRREQRRQRNQKNEPFDPRQNRAFVLRYLTNLLGVRVRNRLRQLK